MGADRGESGCLPGWRGVTDPNFETLLRSPLDDESESNGWGSAVLGLVGGGVAVVGLSFILGLWTTPTGATSTSPATDTVSSATNESVEAANRYPDGFTDVGGSVAMKPVAVVTGDTGFIVSFATAAGRGTDPATTPDPLGGRWQIESVDGSVASTTQLIYDRRHTGVIGAEFSGYPSEGDVIRMTERWDPGERAASLEVPFTGTPFSTTGAPELDFGDGVTLRLNRLELGRHLGQIAWSLSGASRQGGVAAFDVEIVNNEGESVGAYRSMPIPREPATAGDVGLFWDRGFNVHPDEGSVVRITATVMLVSPQSVDVVFELDSVPSGN